MTISMELILREFAEKVREIYDFSLIPSSDKFKPLETIVKDMGGELIYIEGQKDEFVCRYRNGFVFYVSKHENQTYTLLSFARCVAILFLSMDFADIEKFNQKEVMKEYYLSNGKLEEEMLYFANELLLPKETIKNIALSQVKDGYIYLDEIAKSLSMDERIIRARMLYCGIIE